jgi:N-acetyl-1-D-myo-inositol-2-amino-2-deoxy-alpha-D-glucopyranoside deacetylase
MLVHAHPDDESSSTGATMARYVAEGAAVTLVTCTLGELGEVVVPELAHLHADRDDALAPRRLEELTKAMAELGVTDFVRLGGDGRWRDSGMAYDEKLGVVPAADLHDQSFWRADLLETANELVALIRDRRPQVLITYDENGHYGHPDHIQAHRVATYAASLAGVPSYRPDLGTPWQVQRTLWIAMAESMIRTMITQAREAGESNEFFDSFDLDSDEPPLMSVRDSDIAGRIDGYPFAAQRVAALRAHATQIAPDEFFFKLQDAPPGPVWEECFRFAGGVPFDGPADDVFAGLGV